MKNHITAKVHTSESAKNENGDGPTLQSTVSTSPLFFFRYPKSWLKFFTFRIMSSMECPVCGKTFESSLIQNHVNKCIFLNLEDGEEKSPKRTVNQRGDSESAPKKMKLDTLNSPPTPKVIPSVSIAQDLWLPAVFFSFRNK